MGFINLEWFSGPEHTRVATDQAGASRQLILRCADVHPVTCDAEWTAPSASELVARAVDHGVSAHGLNPGWYTRERIAAISRAARGTQDDAPRQVPTETDKATGQPMRDLQLDDAAAALCVSPDTLRAWEQRFGYPHSVPGGAGEPRYTQGEVIALRDSLEAGLSIAAAIDKARGAGTDS
jgi:predicted small metal-binding protein